ncbi:DEAD/DEAH box helicase [Legionella sp. 16cNR16C]|uniref:DEAD/DEAH box helicase n=1 Tax=Legionella sp. 16cNR16C TaxID=2905656 RepID=UPI001E37FA46|nr:DEAD/DEAH box helicase [Legionella sp. 16cNR16C]MCE3043402.1 DEAD/DEAH box helicase [Legionella sp. 16cNR16C]
MLKDALSRMAEIFSPAVLMQGEEYQQKNYVLNIRLSDGLLKARVKGKSGQIYDVYADLKAWPNKPARCNCAQANNCKHAAASFFALQIKENLKISAPPVNGQKEQSLSSWLQTIRAQEVDSKPRSYTHDILYLLEIQKKQWDHRVLIHLALAKRLKRHGTYGKFTVFNSFTQSKKQYCRAEDENIINTLLSKSTIAGSFDKLSLRNSELLEQILRTNRAYLFQETLTQSLSLGEPRELLLRWHLNQQGQQHLVMEDKNAHLLSPLLLDKPWYFLNAEAELGVLHTPYQPSQLKTILEIGPLAMDEVNRIDEIRHQFTPMLPAPLAFAERIQRKGTPKPVIQFDALPLDMPRSTDSTSLSEEGSHFLFIREIFFEYDNALRVHGSATNTSLIYEDSGKLIDLSRNLLQEKQYTQEISQILPTRHASVWEKLNCEQALEISNILVHFQSEQDLGRLFTQVIPLLKSKGWTVEFRHFVYEELVSADDVEWYSELQESGEDFFSYQLGILVEGKSVNIVPLVVELISGLNLSELENIPDERLIRLPLAQGKKLQLPMGRIKPLIRFIMQYGSRFIDNQNQLQIKRYQLILMQETELALAATALRWKGGEQLRSQLTQLLGPQSIPEISPPEGLNAQLRDYQAEGLSWLQFLRESRFGGILADDMGLGKTVQTLAHLQLEKEQGRLQHASLIVAPTSLMGNWEAEAKRFTPELKVLVFHGSNRHQDEFDQYDVIVSTYGLIQRDKARFVNYPFYYLILDEAQFIKNAKTKTTQIIQQIQARHRLCLSGTPLENHLGELWSLFHFLMPGLLGDARQFRRFFKIPIEKNADQERRILLANRVQPFMLRRSKNQVARELPDKTEVVQLIELADAQRDLYEAIRITMEQKVREAIARQGMGKSHIVLLDALLKLRQVCCDPRLLSIPEAKIAHGTSAKLDVLMNLVVNLIEEGRRILIFSQFTSMLELIEERLKANQLQYLKLTGQTVNRHQLVNTFQEGNIPLFLISLKAGGTGLNLTRADTVIHYDPWWNPAAEEQATDRSHRIGQKNPVFVYKLISAGTVEEVILAMQEKKKQLIEGVLGEQTGSLQHLTVNDIEQFFAPLAEE